ncbi:MAG: fluoride exporter [Microbacteriaceae bacterium]|nr:fluoride exporter [Microbacteriaceae bacterium]
MTPLVLVALSLAGGLGAAARFVLDGAIRAVRPVALPIGTILINLSGSLLLGVVVGLSTTAVLPAPARLIVGTGFLGGYTTFSASSYETVRLFQERRVGLALLNSAGLLVACALLAGLGVALGSLA